MDQKLKGCAVNNVENKRRFDNNPRDNHGQQQPPKRQNVNGQNVARAYMVGKNVERKAYAGNLPYCNKDCKAAVVATAQRVSIGNHMGVTCYECGRQGHYRRLLGHPFNINLMHVELGSFDVIVGMDWLAKYHTVIVYDEKVVRIPYGDEVLIIEGGGCNGG
ncbi:reverse transcriptase domain-containing protein, partial [Tanacetum coccineum]